jgi:error-prone DNA polymerase
MSSMSDASRPAVRSPAHRAGLPDYAELHCLSNFSFLRGASHPEELVERAIALGYRAIALTDECSVAGVVRAHLACREGGLQLIIGAEFHLSDDDLHLVLLATDRAGYGQLCERITRARRRGAKGEYAIWRADLESEMTGCLALLVPGDDLDRLAGDARWLATAFPGPDDRPRLRAIEAVARDIGLPMVASGDVHMHRRSRRRLQDTLTAIRLGEPLERCGRRLFANAERHLRQRLRLAQIYPPALLAETLTIAARCHFSLESLRYEYPDEVVAPDRTPAQHLRLLTEEGLRWRYGEVGVSAVVRAQIEHELALIAQLGYESYFLTVYDIVCFARGRGILCQGRGSAANSAVCYALGITEVDPVSASLLFERFISAERNEPPDIDVDFEHERREEVIQYIYRRYGRDRAALAAVVISYRPRSAMRDVGKALGLAPDQVDRLAQSHAWWDGRTVQAQALAAHGFDPDSRVIVQLADLVNTLIRFPRHFSQHPGGFVISRGPLSQLVPVENAAMPERSVIQWDKDDLDALGLLKIDVLALGMLTAVRRAMALINQRYRDTDPATRPAWWPASGQAAQTLAGEAPFTVAHIPRHDAAVFEMISRADTVGVFQIESRAQMAMLPRMRPRTFYDLVIEVAIVRPGPIQGGMVHPYLRRRQGLEPVSYPSAEVESVLGRTLGVPIFQEQVMRLAVVAAGFSPGEADQLRRAMAAWKRKGGIEPFERRLTEGMLARGYSPAFAAQLFQQMLGFGEYGFPESHSASFALIAWQSAWLKHHEPAAFLAALLDSQPMGFYAPSQLVQDARRHGVDVRPVDVLRSGTGSRLEFDTPQAARDGAQAPAVRLGLALVKGLSGDAAERIVSACGQAPFASIDDLARRARLDAGALKALAAAAALDGLSAHRREAYWQVAGIEPRIATDLPLLAEAPIDEPMLEIEAPTEGEDLVADYASTGLTLGRHPLALLREGLAAQRIVTAEMLRQMPHGRLARASGLVIGRQRPDTASGVVFITLEDETGQVNVVVWRRVSELQRREMLASRLMTVYGQVQREGDVVHLVASRLVDHSTLLGRLTTRSRDFH